MFKNVVWVNFDLLENFMVDVFRKVGVPEEDAKICADVLITSDKRGIDCHGVAYLKRLYYDRLKTGQIEPKNNMEIVKETPTTAVVDAHHGIGLVIGPKSMDLAIKKAKEFGTGMVAVRNSTHYGFCGYYPLMAIKDNMIGITGTNTTYCVVPTFGVEPVLGTNPLTFGMPSDEDFPFCLDCATSVRSVGRVEMYERAEKEIPAGLVLDKDGKTRTDSRQVISDLMSGKLNLLPLGGIGEETAGYKGYGYATVVEILSAALQGGKLFKESYKERSRHLGHFFIAINISAFIDVEIFKKITGDILRNIRNSQKAPGEEKIYTAGEKEYLTWLERKDKGAPITKSAQKDFLDIQKELHLDQYKFPF